VERLALVSIIAVVVFAKTRWICRSCLGRSIDAPTWDCIDLSTVSGTTIVALEGSVRLAAC
jgi:hypothetical protein